MSEAPPTGADPAIGRTLFLLATAGFASGVGLRIADAMLPRLAEDFDTTVGLAAQVTGAYAIGYGLFQLVYGPLGDRFGKFRVIAFAALASTFGNLGAALAGGLDSLILFRLLGGITAAGIIPLSMAYIGDAVPYERRQAVLARFLTGSIFGMLTGQAAGGLFADTVGWRGAFGVLAGIFFLVAVLLLSARQARQPGVNRDDLTPFRRLLPSIFAIGWARLVLLVVFLEGLVAFGALAFVPSFLHLRFGVSLTAAGLILALFGLGALVYTFIARWLIARLGETGLTRAGGATMGLAFLGLVLAPHWVWALPVCFAAGLGYYLLHNTLQLNATQMAPHARGTGVSLFASSLFLGQSIGVALGAAAADRVGLVWVFLAVAAALPVLGFSFSKAIARRRAALSRSPPGPD